MNQRRHLPKIFRRDGKWYVRIVRGLNVDNRKAIDFIEWLNWKNRNGDIQKQSAVTEAQG